jgi:hypothetical protein
MFLIIKCFSLGMLDPVRLAQYLFYNPALAIFNGQNGIKLGLANIVCDVLREVIYLCCHALAKNCLC